MEGSRDVTGGGSVISSAIREAVAQFELDTKTELEITGDSVLVSHMRDYALTRIFMMVIDERPEKEIIDFLRRAVQSFKTQRHQKTGNPIRVFRRTH